MERALRAMFPLCAVLIATAAGVAYAQTFPTKTIRLIVPYSPGGGIDGLSRIVAKHLGESFSQTVIVDNRPGAGGTIGTNIVAKAAPDGYTLVTIVASHTIVPSLYKKLPYDSIRDFAPVSLIASSSNVLVVRLSLSVKSVRELIALANQRTSGLTFASAGVGSPVHLAAAYFNSMAKIKAVHVPYQGSGPAEIDLASGRVDYMVDSIPAALPNIKAGRTHPLATTGAERALNLPDIPTVAESGLPQYVSKSWWGILAPAKTPQPVINKLNTEINHIMARQDVKELVLTLGAESWTDTPQFFSDHIKKETAHYARIIKEEGITID